jgi:hypothetical protein
MTISVNDYLFGPPSSQKFGDVELGSSDDPLVVTIKETRVDHRPQGAAAPIAGLSRITSCEASAKTRINELGLANLQRILHRITPLVGTAATTSPSGLSTTLSADAAAGATSIVLTLATNIADNKYLKVGDAGETEICQVDPAWSAGTTIPLKTPLIRAHDSGDPVVMVDDAGTTILQQRIGIIPAASHLDFVAQALDPAGDPCLITISDALGDGTLEITLGETEGSGTPVTFTGFSTKEDPELAPWAIERLTPA